MDNKLEKPLDTGRLCTHTFPTVMIQNSSLSQLTPVYDIFINNVLANDDLIILTIFPLNR